MRASTLVAVLVLVAGGCSSTEKNPQVMDVSGSDGAQPAGARLGPDNAPIPPELAPSEREPYRDLPTDSPLPDPPMIILP